MAEYLLANHVVPESIPTALIANNSGKPLFLTAITNQTLGAILAEATVYVNNATIVSGVDITVANGIIHLIDQVWGCFGCET